MTPPTNTPFADLGSFLSFLEQSGRLQRVRALVDKDWEVACIARWAMESTHEENAYAILFDNIKNHSVPVVVNLYASYALYAAALGVAQEAVLERWADALDRPLSPVIVDTASVQEVVETGGEANLLQIPAPIWTPGRDAGPYLSAAAVITKDPETGVQNMGTYRVQIHDQSRAGLFFGSKMQHGARHYAKYRERQQPMPVAVVVGAPPVVDFAAAAKTAYGVDELEIAGGLMGASVDVVRGESVDLLVPAQAEYVIEGYVPPVERHEEGPFGEALGYMNGPAPAPFVNVTAVCRRHDAIFHGYVQQLPPSEGHIVWEMGSLGCLWYYLREKMGLGSLCDLAVIRGSGGLSGLAAQVKLGHKDGTRDLQRALSQINFGQKVVVIVDQDIDIRDLEALQWAFTTRVDPARDVHIRDDVPCYLEDPSVIARDGGTQAEKGRPPYVSSMMIIDATLKCDCPEISLPAPSYMAGVRKRWPELGLPEPQPRPRLERLLKHHTESGAEFKLAGGAAES